MVKRSDQLLCVLISGWLGSAKPGKKYFAVVSSTLQILVRRNFDESNTKQFKISDATLKLFCESGQLRYALRHCAVLRMLKKGKCVMCRASYFIELPC